MKKILCLWLLISYSSFAEYTVEDFRAVAKKKYSHFNTKVDLLFNAYDEDENSTDNKVTLRLGIYDSEKSDRRNQNIEAFVNECIKLEEDRKLCNARITFLREQEEYYIQASQNEEKEAQVYERTINNTYIEKLFEIREKIFQETYNLEIAEKRLKAKLL